MENKIPTAEEFTISNCMKQMTSREATINSIRGLIEFHVGAALKAANEKAEIWLAKDWIRKTETIHPRELVYPITIKVNEESILNAYPKELIQ